MSSPNPTPNLNTKAPTTSTAEGQGQAPSIHSSIVLLKSFLKSLLNTLDVQASTQVQVVTSPEEIATFNQNIDVAATLSMSGPSVQGSLAICFPQSTFLPILERMLGETMTEITQENADASGELLNIIYASARPEINQKGFGLGLAIPSVIRGQCIHVSPLQDAKFFRVFFKTENGPFFLEFSMREVATKVA